MDRFTLTIEEACAYLSISRSLGYRLARAGEFPCTVIRAGRRLLVVRAALDHLLEIEKPTGDGGPGDDHTPGQEGHRDI